MKLLDQSKIFLASLLCLFSFAIGADAQNAQSTDTLYAEAKKEGQVRFSGPLTGEEMTNVLKVFEDKYPGVKVVYSRRPTGALVQLMEAERTAGKSSFDLVHLTDPLTFLRWKKENFLLQVDVPETSKMAEGFFDKDGYFTALCVTTLAGTYNSLKVAERDIPKSLKELSDPKWVGKISISNPSRGGGITIASLMNASEGAVPDFVKNAANLKLLITNGNENAVESVVTGETSLNWGLPTYLTGPAAKDGAPIKFIYWQEGTAVVPILTGVMAKAQSPNAAKLLLNWLLSTEGQNTLITKEGVYSARNDIDSSPEGLPKLSTIKVNNYGIGKLGDGTVDILSSFNSALGLK